MKRFRLLVAAAVFGLVTTACSSDLVGPDAVPTVSDAPSQNVDGDGRGEGGFGSGG